MSDTLAKETHTTRNSHHNTTCTFDKGKTIPVLIYAIRHFAMKTYGGVEVQPHHS
jgi:hypothetical protein